MGGTTFITSPSRLLITVRPVWDHQAEQFTECRIDHYQTPNEVHVSVFAKQADRDRSKVTVEETQVGMQCSRLSTLSTALLMRVYAGPF